MKLDVVFSNVAELDLVAIHDYIADFRPEAAKKTLLQIKAECGRLGSMPLTGSKCDALQPGLRFRVVGKYVVFYRVTDDVVWIQRVLHSARDFEKLL